MRKIKAKFLTEIVNFLTKETACLVHLYAGVWYILTMCYPMPSETKFLSNFIV